MKNAFLLAGMLLATLPAIAAAHRCEPSTEAQIDAQGAKFMSLVDANHDGQLTKAEMTSFGARHRGFMMINDQRWKHVDVNRDGRLSTTEITSLVRMLSACHKGR